MKEMKILLFSYELERLNMKTDHIQNRTLIHNLQQPAQGANTFIHSNQIDPSLWRWESIGNLQFSRYKAPRGFCLSTSSSSQLLIHQWVTLLLRIWPPPIPVSRFSCIHCHLVLFAYYPWQFLNSDSICIWASIFQFHKILNSKNIFSFLLEYVW